MIILTRLDGNRITLNCDEIEYIDESHDSIISMVSGRKIRVKERFEEIISLVTEFKRNCIPGDIKESQAENDV